MVFCDEEELGGVRLEGGERLEEAEELLARLPSDAPLAPPGSGSIVLFVCFLLFRLIVGRRDSGKFLKTKTCQQ